MTHCSSQITFALGKEWLRFFFVVADASPSVLDTSIDVNFVVLYQYYFSFPFSFILLAWWIYDLLNLSCRYFHIECYCILTRRWLLPRRMFHRRPSIFVPLLLPPIVSSSFLLLLLFVAAPTTADSDDDDEDDDDEDYIYIYIYIYIYQWIGCYQHHPICLRFCGIPKSFFVVAISTRAIDLFHSPLSLLTIHLHPISTAAEAMSSFVMLFFSFSLFPFLLEDTPVDAVIIHRKGDSNTRE